MYTLRDVCRRDSGESYTCARPTGQRGLRTPAFGADTVTGREEPVRHVVRGPFGFLGPRPARPAVNIHSFIHLHANFKARDLARWEPPSVTSKASTRVSARAELARLRPVLEPRKSVQRQCQPARKTGG